jgi:hypothetical protein
VVRPFVKPGTEQATRELCHYCWDQRDREEVLTRHDKVAVCSDSDLLSEDDYNHYFSSWTIETRWYCEYCEEMKDSSDVYRHSVRIWVCPRCMQEWEEEENAANCCD